MHVSIVYAVSISYHKQMMWIKLILWLLLRIGTPFDIVESFRVNSSPQEIVTMTINKMMQSCFQLNFGGSLNWCTACVCQTSAAYLDLQLKVRIGDRDG